MSIHQKIFALLVSLILLGMIIELVRRRKLREEYSWLWILSGLIVFLLAVWENLLLIITKFIGAIAPVTTVFVFGIFFLIIISLHFSIKISSLSQNIKNLAQKIVLLEDKLKSKNENEK